MGSRISVLIEYIPGGQGSVDYIATGATLSEQGNNISNTQALNTAHSGGIKPFILGVSKLGTVEQGGDGHVFWSEQEEWRNGVQVGGKYNGFWSRQWGDENGEFENPITFQILGENINKFVIRFDEALGEYASVINVDGTDYENTGEFVWAGIESNTHYITIKKWNKPQKQVKITSILIGLVVEYDRRYFRQGGGVNAASRQTFDNAKPSYGIAAQYGSFEVVDIDGNFTELSQVDLLTDGLRCGVFMNAEPYEAGADYEEYRTANKGKMLGDYRLAEVSFIDTAVESELTDDILNWGMVYQDGIADSPENTAFALFTKLQEVTPDTISIDQDTTAHLENIKMPDGSIPPSMLSEAWDIFCWATLTRISKNAGGDIWLTR